MEKYDQYFQYDGTVDVSTNHSITHIKINKDVTVIWPPCVTHVILHIYYNLPIDLPHGVTHVDFGYRYNQPTTLLPKNLKYLKFGDCYNQPVILPPRLKYIEFGEHYNQPIILPPHLKYIKFGDHYHQPTILTCALKRVMFGYDFNYNIIIPPHVEHLHFGYLFNQSVELPETLTHLTLGHYFNQNIIFPRSIKNFHLHGSHYARPNNIPALGGIRGPRGEKGITSKKYNIYMMYKDEQYRPYKKNIWNYKLLKRWITHGHVVYSLDPPQNNIGRILISQLKYCYNLTYTNVNQLLSFVDRNRYNINHKQTRLLDITLPAIHDNYTNDCITIRPTTIVESQYHYNKILLISLFVFTILCFVVT